VCDIHTMEPVRSAQELGERIREARMASGLKQGVVAERVGMDRSAFVRVESGERKVTAVELFAIGEVLDFPISYFVYKPDPAIVSQRSDLSEDDGEATKGRYRADAILQAFARDAEWLRTEGYLRPVEVPDVHFRSVDDARSAAKSLRRQLGLRGPIDSVVAVAERSGLYVRVTSTVRADGSSLTPQPGFGVAVVSSLQEPGRRRFTVAHELGHHLLGDEYSSDVGVAAGRDDREAMIDSFAAELLLPRRELKAEWGRMRDLSTRDTVVTLAARYRVSWSSLIDSVRGAGLVSSVELAPLRAQTPVRGEFIALLGEEPTEDVRGDTTGPIWRRSVMRAYTDGRLTRARTVELLAGAIEESDLPDVGVEPAP
jgi:Zn-dependent peptidase ImmA (M78 family)/transcriptional regulator with XRE-family HTH domain